MPGDSTQQMSARVVHLSLHPVAVALFGHRRASAQRFRRQEARVRHGEWLEDDVACELVEPPAAHSPHEFA